MKADLHNIRKIFDNMAEEGFDSSMPLRWGFFFVDGNKDSLENLATYLEKQGYNFVKIEMQDDQEWKLNINKIDILHPDALHQLNLEFNAISEQFDVRLYDGWDVERV